jgi:hypothetical protein
MHTLSMSVPQFLILLAILALFVGNRRLRWHTEHLHHELLNRFHVYSAETTRGKEAEFIREHLPRRFPKTLLVLLALGVFGAAAWWLMR